MLLTPVTPYGKVVRFGITAITGFRNHGTGRSKFCHGLVLRRAGGKVSDGQVGCACRWNSSSSLHEAGQPCPVRSAPAAPSSRAAAALNSRRARGALAPLVLQDPRLLLLWAADHVCIPCSVVKDAVQRGRLVAKRGACKRRSRQGRGLDFV